MPLTHTSAELSAWLRLSLEPNVGSATACTLLSALGLPEQIYAQRATALARHLPDALARQLAAAMPADMAAQVNAALQWVDAPHRHIVTLADPTYPQSLLTIADPPILLYVVGDPAYLQGPSLAVVGARNATPGGQETARAFARHLAGHGWRVVSGLALGIDAAAHEGALDAGPDGAGTVAVMGTGIDRIYPARHRDLAHRIAGNGALVSEFLARAPCRPTSQTQPHRGGPGSRRAGGGSGQAKRLAHHGAAGRRKRARSVCHPRLDPLAVVARLPCLDSAGRKAGGNRG